MTVREQFESWINSEVACQRDAENPNKYWNTVVQNKWEGFQAMSEFCNDWVKFDGENYPAEFGRYLVKSSYGICLAEYHEWGSCFQDLASNNDEGMVDTDGEAFEVYEYKAIH